MIIHLRHLHACVRIASFCGVMACTAAPQSGTNPLRPAAPSGGTTASAGSAAPRPPIEIPPVTPIAGAAGGLIPIAPTPPAPAAGSGGAAAPQDCGTVTRTSDVQQAAADIVWIIDGSGSMADERMAVQQNITSFARAIAAAGIDHHVIMLAEDDIAATTALGAEPKHYLYVEADVGSHDALERLIEHYPDYQAFLREGASLHFVVVSDDESDLPAGTFRTRMRELAGKEFIFHAIASESVNGLACTGTCGIPILCGGASPGLHYYALADATGGQKVSICTQDWSQVFGPLQEAVIASTPLPCDYAIPAPPSGERLDADKVNLDFSASGNGKQRFPRAASAAACGTDVAWYYDDPSQPKTIRMCPSACDMIKTGGMIQIQLGCATVSLE